jgi:sec-independent protein translocase protein TatA
VIFTHPLEIAKMALDPLELATIVGIILVLFLWGPQKIPELARMIGRARREFDNATREFQNAAKTIQDGTNPLFAPLTSPPSPPVPQPGVRSALPPTPASSPAAKTGDELLIEAARKLGISTQGKTRGQIQEEIIALAQRQSAPKDPSQPPEEDDPAA